MLIILSVFDGFELSKVTLVLGNWMLRATNTTLRTHFLRGIVMCAGKGQMWSPSDDDHVPEYYRQWAATIARLGHDEQVRTLAQMSEDDRLIVQRLMDHSSVHLPGSTDLDKPEVLFPQAAHHLECMYRQVAVNSEVHSMLGMRIFLSMPGPVMTNLLCSFMLQHPDQLAPA